jgi:putative ATPase
MQNLFDDAKNANAPLAERLRPKVLDEFVGQKHLLGEGGVLRALIESDNISSMIFWGPPGTGKTTLAEIIAKKTESRFMRLEATSGGKAELKKILDDAAGWLSLHKKRTILFIDEIHRWNKTQQDVLLPSVERGAITLIGATTENPSFEVVGALLSRCQVFVLNQFSQDELLEILKRAMRLIFEEQKIKISFEAGAPSLLLGLSGGDARSLLGVLELLLKTKKASENVLLLRKEDVKNAYTRANVFYDKGGEEHYNIISALHKSLRGSDANAALYWLGRMLESGDDPLYVARRLVRFASEDIGLADPQALVQAVSGYQAAHYLGLPECNVILAQVVAYLARAPKSNALYKAYGEIQKDIKELPREPVPLHLRNAPTELMKDLGYGKNYKYNPNYKGEVHQEYLPPGVRGRKYLEK